MFGKFMPLMKIFIQMTIFTDCMLRCYVWFKGDIVRIRISGHNPFIRFVETKTHKSHLFVKFDGVEVVFMDVESDSGDGRISLGKVDHVTKESRRDTSTTEV